MTNKFSAKTFSKKSARKIILPKLVKNFKNDQEGVTAIEFAMLGPAFFGLMLAIIETSLLFFAGQMLESSVDNVGRQVRVGILGSSTTEAQLKAEVCEQTKLLFTCGGLKVDLQVVADFQSLGNKPQLGSGGNLDDANYNFTQPDRNQIVMLTVDYEWPVFTNYMAAYLSNLSSGNARVTAVSVFQTEPW